MGMTREIQRTLERSLPQYVLDYLNEEFLKREESFEKVKELEKKVEKLLWDIQERDRVLWQTFKDIGTTREMSGYQPMGFAIGGYNRPNYDLEIPYMQRGRGGRGGGGRGGSNRNEGFPGIYAQGGGGSGGSGGGSGSGSSGGSSGGGGATAHFKEPFRKEFEEVYDPPIPDIVQ
jgi:hypothetical protein